MNRLIERLKFKQSARQLLRYGLVGIAQNVIGYGTYLLVTYLGAEPKLTVTLLYPMGATISYIGNRQWSFGHEGAVLKSGIRYCIAHVCGYLLNVLLLFSFVDKLGYHHQWVQAAAMFVVAAFLFLSFKFFVFRTGLSGVDIQH